MLDRLDSWEQDSNGCWVWQKSLNSEGYGNFWLEGQCTTAHKVMWESVNGPVPFGLELDHTCENKACINPSHIEAVTHQENIRRHHERHKQAHCNNGHEFTAGNVVVKGDGRRRCRECIRAYDREYKKGLRLHEQAKSA